MYSENWKSILDDVHSFGYNTSIWFRGLNSDRHKLNSGLFRLNFDSITEYIVLESQLFTYYKNLGYLLHKEEAPWNLLYSMQHNGVKTRLLDWTESFAVALFFATEGWKTGSVRIWMLKPLELNNLVRDKPEIISPSKIKYPEAYKSDSDHINSLAIYPIKNGKRIIAQHGVFTIQGNAGKPLEEEHHGELTHSGILKHIDLPLEVREDAYQFLKHNGINKYSLFPDLDGLSKYINDTIISPNAL